MTKVLKYTSTNPDEYKEIDIEKAVEDYQKYYKNNGTKSFKEWLLTEI